MCTHDRIQNIDQIRTQNPLANQLQGYKWLHLKKTVTRLFGSGYTQSNTVKSMKSCPHTVALPKTARNDPTQNRTTSKTLSTAATNTMNTHHSWRKVFEVAFEVSCFDFLPHSLTPRGFCRALCLEADEEGLKNKWRGRDRKAQALPKWLWLNHRVPKEPQELSYLLGKQSFDLTILTGFQTKKVQALLRNHWVYDYFDFFRNCIIGVIIIEWLLFTVPKCIPRLQRWLLCPSDFCQIIKWMPV